MPRGLRPGNALLSTNPFELLRAVAYRGNALESLVETVKNPKKQGSLLDLSRAVLNVAQPGTGDRLHELHGSVKRAGATFLAGAIDDVVDEAEPWSDFLLHYRALPWGVVCIVGDPGQGKTEFLKKSLLGWHERSGERMEVVNFYEGEEPPGAKRSDPERLIARIMKVDRFIRQEKGEVFDDGLTAADFKKRKGGPAARVTQGEIDAMSFRLIGVDEAGMFFSSLSSRGGQDEREAAKRWSDQIRHLRSKLVFVAQKLSDIPPHVRASAVMIYKMASRDTINLDFKPGTKRDTMQRWFEAIAALQAVKTGVVVDLPEWLPEPARDAIRAAARAHVFYEGPLADQRSWGYCVAPTLGGHGVRTVFPFLPHNPAIALGSGEESELIEE